MAPAWRGGAETTRFPPAAASWVRSPCMWWAIAPIPSLALLHVLPPVPRARIGVDWLPVRIQGHGKKSLAHDKRGKLVFRVAPC